MIVKIASKVASRRENSWGVPKSGVPKSGGSRSGVPKSGTKIGRSFHYQWCGRIPLRGPSHSPFTGPRNAQPWPFTKRSMSLPLHVISTAGGQRGVFDLQYLSRRVAWSNYPGAAAQEDISDSPGLTIRSSFDAEGV